MLTRPFDLSVSEEEFAKANAWWRNLSINQMKGYESKYFPDLPWDMIMDRRIHQMWEEEGKPLPQELIPVMH